jgi:hypothetical protein
VTRFKAVNGRSAIIHNVVVCGGVSVEASYGIGGGVTTETDTIEANKNAIRGRTKLVEFAIDGKETICEHAS